MRSIRVMRKWSSRTLQVKLIDPFASFFDDPRGFLAFFRSQRTGCALNDGVPFDDGL